MIGRLTRVWALLALCCGVARGYVVLRAEPSLEALEARSDVIVRGTIFSDELHPTLAGQAPLRRVTLDTTDVLKGAPPRRFVFTIPPRDAGEDLGRTGDALLVLLQYEDGGSAANTGSETLRSLRALDAGVLRLNPPPRAYGMDGVERVGAAQIVDVLKDAAAHPDGERRAESFTQIWAMGPKGAGLLEVPLDQRFERLTHGWLASPDADVRIRAIRYLVHFRNRTSIEKLHELARWDPHYRVYEAKTWRSDPAERATRLYTVRDEAAQLLHAWTLPVKAAVEAPYQRYAPLRPARALWPTAVVLAGVCLLARGRPDPATLGAAALALLCVGAAAAWTRSHLVCDSVACTLGRSSVEVVSRRGGVGVLVVQDAPPAHAAMIRSFNTEFTDWWFRAALVPTTESAWRGFGHARGQTRESLYAFRLVQAPWWAVTAALGLWPAGYALRQTVWALRRAGRLARHRCPHCGYDLTGNLSGRCPECGGESIRRVRTRAFVVR